MATNQALETAILTNNLPALDGLLSSATIDPIDALTLSAKLSRHLPFSHLLTTNPTLTSSLNTEPLLLAALTSSSVPIWRTILEHEPSAKNHRFGHFGTVVERCVQGGKKDLLEFLLGEGARVEMTGSSILLRAEVCGASEDIKELLVRYGAQKGFEEE